MAAVKKILALEALRSRLSTSFDSTYQTLGVPLVHPIRMFKFTNTTASDVLVSFDGVTDHEIVPASSFMLIDISSNRVWDAEYVLSAQTQVYVNGTLGVSGSIYLSTYYAT